MSVTIIKIKLHNMFIPQQQQQQKIPSELLICEFIKIYIIQAERGELGGKQTPITALLKTISDYSNTLYAY